MRISNSSRLYDSRESLVILVLSSIVAGYYKLDYTRLVHGNRTGSSYLVYPLFVHDRYTYMRAKGVAKR